MTTKKETIKRRENTYIKQVEKKVVLDSTVLNYIFVHIFLLAYAYAGYSANVSQHIAGGPERL